MIANTKTCSDVMVLCATRLGNRRSVDWRALGQRVAAMVEKMEGATVEDIASEVLSGSDK